MANSTNSIFVTYVDAFHDLLKVWGQPNRICATYIDKQLLKLVPEFNRTSPPAPNAVHSGMFCFTKYADGNYYRARIVSEVYENCVTVVLIDYGNKDNVDLSNIRIRCDAVESVLVKMVPQAEEFYLAKIGSRGGWSPNVINEVRRDLCYEDYNYATVYESELNQRLIQINFRNEDYANVLIRKELGRAVSLKDQIIMLKSANKNQLLSPEQMGNQNVSMPGNVNYGYQVQQHEQVNRRNDFFNHSKTQPIPKVSLCEPQQQLQQQQYQQHQQHVAPRGHSLGPVLHSHGHGPVHQRQMQNINTYAVGDRQYGVVNSPPSAVYGLNNNNVMYPDTKNSPVLNSVVIEALANQLKQHLMKDSSPTKTDSTSHNFITQVLEVGSTHNVYVSYIDDGPWSFSIQLVASEHELNQLMDDLAACDLVPIKLPVVLGYSCIAKSKQYDNYCRGVVVNISHSAVKIFFVDFGNTEDLPVTSIFELPVKFFKVKAMSQKFALSGLQRIKPSDEIKRSFVEVVENELLLLHVTTLEGENLPTCDLYLKNVNIKRILNEKVRQVKKWDPIELPQAGRVENVVVTWIDNPQRFYVQLKNNDKDLESLKRELAEWGVCGQVFNVDELIPGAVCICCFTGDNQWYRAIITSVNSKTSVTVFYVDYGNREVVSSNMIKKVGNGLIRQMNTQAIECCLHGFENRPPDPNVTRALEALTWEKELRLQVVYAEKTRIVVKLFDNDKDILQSLLQPEIHSQPVPNFSAQNPKEVPVNPAEEKVSNAPRSKPDKRNKSNSPPSQGVSSEDTNKSWRKRDERGSDSWRTEDSRKDTSFKMKDFKIGRFTSGKGGQFGSRPGRKDNSSEDEKDVRDKSWRATDGRKSYGVGGPGVETRNFEKYNDKNKVKHGEGVGTRMKKAAKENEIRGQKLGGLEQSRYPVKLDNIAPRGMAFKEERLEIGSVEEVIVTYFLNPSEIYVQLLSKKEEFRKLMDEMQTYYASKLPLISEVQVAVGDKVVAQFREDGVLYRAVVIETNPLRVRYADYGNEELTERERLWAMDKKFMELEALSLKCCLPNLKPYGCNSWPEPNSQIDKIFEHEKYTCTFLNRTCDAYEVKLLISDTGKDVSDELISSGFAVASHSIEHSPSDTVIIQKRTPMDFTLMENETFNVYVSHIVDVSEFYVQIRCNVLQCVEEVRNDCSEVEKIKTVPDDLPGYSPKVVQCFLTSSANELSAEAVKEFQACSKKFFLACVHEVVDRRLKVTLYDLNGHKLDFLAHATDGPERIRPVTTAPIINQGIIVTPSFIVSPREVYIHCMADVPELEELNGHMLSFYNGGGDDYVEDEEAIVKLCAAKSVSDHCWYRARILLLNQDSAKVFYVDVGNIEEVPRGNIKRLNSSFMGKHEFARKVSLNIDYSENSAKDIQDELGVLINDKLCQAYFAKEEDFLFAEFVVDDVPVTDQLLRFDAQKLHGDMFRDIVARKPEPEKVPLLDEALEDVKVFISHVSSPSEFWIHRESISNELEAFQNNIQSVCLKGNRRNDAKVGDVVGALFTDQVWYRAKVTSTDGDVLCVQFIDYGNTLQINMTENGVVELSEDLVQVPVFASCCSLRGRWKENAGSRFEEIITEHQDPFTLVELEQGEVRVVDLLQNGESVTEKLIKEGYGSGGVESEKRDMVYITHINSPNDFYVHREGDQNLLDAIINGLLGGDSFEDAVNVQDGEIYCAKFVEDDMWYRAKVIKRNASDITVLFIDYGNVANVPSLKLLPPELKAAAVMAPNCSLAYGDENDTWSEAACDKFAEYLQIASLKMDVVAAGSQKSVVRLFTETGESITDILARLCEKDDRIDVFISHANSPSDFYVVRRSDPNLDVIAEGMTSADTFDELPVREVGKLCASKFEDGSWYRARITKICDDFCEVFFLEYGNTSLSSELKALPAEMEAIEPLARRSSLNFPVTNIPESIKEEFRNLTGEGETVLRCRVIKPGDPDVVSLILDGKKLEESLLYSLSENSEVYNIPLDGDNQNDATDIGGKPNIEEVRDSTEDYEKFKLDADARAGNHVANETDEEKRVKFAIITSENTEGFKSDDEKGLLNSNINIPDNELLESSDSNAPNSETEYETTETNETESPIIHIVNGKGFREETVKHGESSPDGTLVSEDSFQCEVEGNSDGDFYMTASEESSAIDAPERNDENTTENHSGKNHSNNVNASKCFLGKSEKIVPGSVSRGETFEPGKCPPDFIKLSYSEKIVPGSIARGQSMLEVSTAKNACEPPPLKRTSSSAPVTPPALRRHHQAYQPMMHQDRLLPACVSRGVMIESFPLEKTCYDEKLISSAVDGTTENGTS